MPDIFCWFDLPRLSLEPKIVDAFLFRESLSVGVVVLSGVGAKICANRGASSSLVPVCLPWCSIVCAIQLRIAGTSDCWTTSAS